jgi:hypothetical protein
MARRNTKPAAPPGMRQMIGTAAARVARACDAGAPAPGRSPARAILLGLAVALLAVIAVKEGPALQRELKIWMM